VNEDCASNQLCVVNTCCRGGGGICVNAVQTCSNGAMPKALFVRRPAGETVMG
jgi:hypothetical protein